MALRAALIAAATFGLTANAHLFIQSPTPIQGSAPKDPLESTGANFPCHGVALPSSGGQSMPAGSSQLLKFDDGATTNTAVHGGGSCQLSITYETDPAKVKKPESWSVLYSIEGGCPSNTYQNLDGGYTGPLGKYTGALQCTDPKANGVDCINQFNFTIPKGVKSGHATLAWTWFNTVGNREMYMNCASVDLTGGDGSEMDSFPSMFVANLAGIDHGDCPTTQSMNLQFPNPGKYVTTKTPSGAAAHTASTFPMAKPTGSGCSGDGGAASGGSGSSPASYGSPPSSASAAPPAYGSASAAQSAAVTQATGGSGGSGGAAVTVTTMATVTGAPSSAPAVASSYAAPSSAAPTNGRAGTGSSSGTGSSGSCADGAVSCSDPGAVVCIGSSQFGICDVNNCAVPRPLAAGTHCSGGTIAKRSHRHVAKHLAPRRSFHA